jgi:hypothetical protein
MQLHSMRAMLLAAAEVLVFDALLRVRVWREVEERLRDQLRGPSQRPRRRHSHRPPPVAREAGVEPRAPQNFH